MFPSLNKNSITDNSEKEVPQYYEMFYKSKYKNPFSFVMFVIHIDEGDTFGFIVPDYIYFRFILEEISAIDFSKEYVFICFKNTSFNGTLPHSLILQFLQYKSKIFLIVYKDFYIFLEKTPDTYAVCIELDNIYNEKNFNFKNITSRKNSKNIPGDCYIELINEYKNKTGKNNIKYNDDIDILTNLLKLKVEYDTIS